MHLHDIVSKSLANKHHILAVFIDIEKALTIFQVASNHELRYMQMTSRFGRADRVSDNSMTYASNL